MTERGRGRAPKATVTSDVARPRTLLLSALGATIGAAIAVVLGDVPLASPRPIARPHAKLACSSCHGETAQTAPATSASGRAYTAAACSHCHGATHGSTRAGHRRLAARGELDCATCHPQHAGGQGVTFEADSVVRWGTSGFVSLSPGSEGVRRFAMPPGTTVPLVPLAACASCHDVSSAADPIVACMPREAATLAAAADAGSAGNALRATFARCFDEHRTVNDARGGTSRGADQTVCAAQHSPTRFVAWDAAREIAARTPWVAEDNRSDVPWMPAGGAFAGAIAVGAVATAIERRRRRALERLKPALPVVPSARKRLPVIEPSTCLGCYACVDACPFDVLAVEKYVAVVARPEECCGVVLCEQVCPNGSLRIEDGESVLDRPAIDDSLESRDVPGLFLAGDLTGLPLIKNAIHQGVRAVDAIAASLPRRRDRTLDVLVVGAGPAGLSAALRAKELGLSCVIVEQATMAASIKSFPRDKIVHDPPLDLPVEGALWLKEATKEELLAQWTRIARARALDIREGHRLVDLVKSDDGFVAMAERAEDGARVELTATRVVLAIGRRGTPRRLDLEIEHGAEDRIFHALADARSFEGKRVVVVGLGDSAMEAAISLARQPGTTVTIAYRGANFARGKSKNIAELKKLVAEQKLRIYFETVPVAMTTTSVTLQGTGPHGGRRSIGADAMFVLVGGVPAWDLLTRVGIVRPTRQDPIQGTKEPSRA